MLHQRYATAWTFHRNTSRWPHNMYQGGERPPDIPSFREYLEAPFVPLPAPDLPAIRLDEALARRATCRRYAPTSVDLASLGTLLAGAYGARGRTTFGDLEFIERPVPSGGGLYPLELYLLVDRVTGLTPGVYHYAVLGHGLEQLRSLHLPRQLVTDLFMSQPYAAEAAFVIVIAAVLERSLWKYGDRGYRYILLEAGHTAQNLNLVAGALGLGSANLGGFFDDDLCSLLGLFAGEELPLYGIAIGTPDGDDLTALRQPVG
jgi:SagB-type dehydrogenase family enzyme